jgi:YesN/AraC family two-component response regulator
MKPIIKAIIVDDESGQFDALKGRLKLENITDIVIVATAETIKEAVEAILFHQPQLVFLDIDMSGNNESGFDLFTELEKINFKINFKVVFVTGNAKPHYALEAFKHNALGYLVKGADLGKRLVRVIDECREQINLQAFFVMQQQQIQSIMHCKCRTIYDETIGDRRERLDFKDNRWEDFRQSVRNFVHRIRKSEFEYLYSS